MCALIIGASKGIGLETTRQTPDANHDARALSSAAAFVEVSTPLPRWRWAARTASLPGAMIARELGYSLFLPIRPLLSHLFGHVLRLQAVIGAGKSG
jgi:hypothetical protein